MSTIQSDLKLDVDQAGELKAAFRREGPWTNEDIKRLSDKKGLLTDVLSVIHGLSEIKPIEHAIDCDAQPMIPDGLTIEKHEKGGVFHLTPTSIGLYLSKRQKNGKVISGNDLRKELEAEPVLNACVLDYLLAHQNLIPESWKEKAVFFWGTVYRNAGGSLYVRYLCWGGGRWFWACGWLDDDWDGDYPAAVLSK